MTKFTVAISLARAFPIKLELKGESKKSGNKVMMSKCTWRIQNVGYQS
ncbi:hypothetical protein H1P_780011 [Hyella patelloides LEGE 07179]|uniref:Uncharacterized protein n=1 Tax=Hyella patelloides LEGE 07179 TaxID=945734 RepID=A0A563W3Y5_9CYAN|nr:hypothetical protein H1P_780011 [Hyella patelloides LEGE 07179]